MKGHCHFQLLLGYLPALGGVFFSPKPLILPQDISIKTEIDLEPGEDVSKPICITSK